MHLKLNFRDQKALLDFLGESIQIVGLPKHFFFSLLATHHGVFFSGRRGVRLLWVTRVPRGSMGRLYIYLHEWLIFMVKVGKYILHDGSFGSHITYLMISTSVTYYPTKKRQDFKHSHSSPRGFDSGGGNSNIFGVFPLNNWGSCSAILTGMSFKRVGSTTKFWFPKTPDPSTPDP